MCDDYKKWLDEFNISAEFVKNLSNVDDITDNHFHNFVYISESNIHGTGVFAGKNFIKGEFVAFGRVNNERTNAGRYMNHSPNKSAYFVTDGEDIAMIASKVIDKDEEITLNYRKRPVNAGGIIL